MAPVALEYRGEVTLAAKATGATVKLRCDEFGKACVVKTYKKSLRPKSALLERAALKHLCHPLIASLLRTASDEDHLFVVLEAALGGPLQRHIAKAGRLPLSAARYYAAQVAVAVDHVHAQRVIHRDLKASNVVLDARGRVKLVDFGAAAVLESCDDERSTLCGTPHAMAPEMIRRQKYGCGVDWWALGVLFAEMLGGRPPFWDEDESRLEAKILRGDAALPDVGDADTAAVLRTLLSHESRARRSARERHAGWFGHGGFSWSNIVDAPPPPFCADLGYLDWIEDMKQDDDDHDHGGAFDGF